MPTLTFFPKPPASGAADGPFTQEIRLVDDKRAIGSIRWHSAGTDGVVQLLDLFVRDADRRAGHGKRLVEAAEAQARAFHGRGLRRIWCQVRQKTQVNARALLTGRGYQHVGTVKDLYLNEDGLTYVKTFD